jgi:hypothetical protein
VTSAFCLGCEQTLPLEAFARKRVQAVYARCAECRRKWHAEHYQKNKEHRTAWQRSWNEANRDTYRNGRLRAKYNLSLAEYEAKLTAQNGTCAVCRRPESRVVQGSLASLCVDHDHACCPGKASCGKCVRGLLCFVCNLTLGALNDDPELLRRMADYLEAYSCPSRF